MELEYARLAPVEARQVRGNGRSRLLSGKGSSAVVNVVQKSGLRWELPRRPSAVQPSLVVLTEFPVAGRAVMSGSTVTLVVSTRGGLRPTGGAERDAIAAHPRCVGLRS